jgi:hypothetical protein
METSKGPAPRTPLRIQVQFRKNYARQESAGTLRNISLTGAFLCHGAGELASGERLQLRVLVSGRERLISAKVVWTNRLGSGIQFLPQNNRDTQIIDDLIYFVESKRSGTKSILDQIFKRVA